MFPEHYELALQEPNQLEDQELIKPTNSQWTCEAFYVNKCTEQAKNKLRLVIYVNSSNGFLADSKFPLPQRVNMFQHLIEARIFLKFDLKARFW